jgi:pyruvate dehydrogenase E2 component (dihydrolipoamide acetyltransferase)
MELEAAIARPLEVAGRVFAAAAGAGGTPAPAPAPAAAAAPAPGPAPSFDQTHAAVVQHFASLFSTPAAVQRVSR